MTTSSPTRPVSPFDPNASVNIDDLYNEDILTEADIELDKFTLESLKNLDRSSIWNSTSEITPDESSTAPEPILRSESTAAWCTPLLTHKRTW